jgi:hypothetical protein
VLGLYGCAAEEIISGTQRASVPSTLRSLLRDKDVLAAFAAFPMSPVISVLLPLHSAILIPKFLENSP